jgi:hypothetical protein
MTITVIAVVTVAGLPCCPMNHSVFVLFLDGRSGVVSIFSLILKHGLLDSVVARAVV